MGGRSLRAEEHNWTISEKECLAVIVRQKKKK